MKSRRHKEKQKGLLYLLNTHCYLWCITIFKADGLRWGCFKTLMLILKGNPRLMKGQKYFY